MKLLTLVAVLLFSLQGIAQDSTAWKWERIYSTDSATYIVEYIVNLKGPVYFTQTSTYGKPAEYETKTGKKHYRDAKFRVYEQTANWPYRQILSPNFVCVYADGGCQEDDPKKLVEYALKFKPKTR